MGAIRVANALCSWGDLGIEGLEGESIGYQQMLDELVETGYIGTDLGDWGYMPTDPDNQIFALLKSLGTLGLLLVAFPVSLWCWHRCYGILGTQTSQAEPAAPKHLTHGWQDDQITDTGPLISHSRT